MKIQNFTFDQIKTILEKTREAIFDVQGQNFGQVDNITIYVPEYFIFVLREFHVSTVRNVVYVSELPFHENGSFYGVKKMFPSPYNQIIVSTTTAPLENPSLTKIIQL
jgi:hypothetical protein